MRLAGMRKAQINSQILVYILAVVITAIILIYGYKAINDIRTSADTVELLTFKSDLRSAITTISSDYGSIKVKVFRMPAGFSELCFVNYEFQPNEAFAEVPSTLSSEYRLIKDRISSVMYDKVESKNVFLCPTCKEQDYVGNITLLDEEGSDVAFRCFHPSGGSLRLTLEGQGDKTQIS
jgi:hypothetical protein